MIPYAALAKFFCDLVAEAQGRGIPGAIARGTQPPRTHEEEGVIEVEIGQGGAVVSPGC